MKSVYLAILLAILLILTGCHEKVPAESTQPTTAVTVTTEPAVPETTALETTLQETTVPEIVPQKTTESPREYVPQNPDTTEYPKDSIQATLSFFSGMLYVNDNRVNALAEELPDGYIYIGVTGNAGPSTVIPRRALVTCNVPEHTVFYGSLEEPDYIYYEMDGKYRRMIRAGLIENYWDNQEIDPKVPENYTELFFESLLTANFSQNRYHCAIYSEFDTPENVDLYYLFYSGFNEERQRQITAEEENFLLSDGWGENLPVSNAKRLPVWRMDGDLRRFFGITFDDISGVGINQWESYWTETGCYYIWRSGSIGMNLAVSKVVYDEDSGIYAVTYAPEFGGGTKVMRLRLSGDAFQVLSNKTN